MGKLANVLEAGPPRVGHWCPVCAWLESLDVETRSEAEAMIADTSWKPAALVEQFAPLGCAGLNSDIHMHRQSAARRG